jgi:hypothetical protein
MRTVSEWLSGGETPDPKRVLTLALQPATKRIVLVATGLRFPRHRDVYFDLARKLNFDKRSPHLLLKEILESKTATQPATTRASVAATR